MTPNRSTTVAYIFNRFPVNSQAFAEPEMRSLERYGVTVLPIALLPGNLALQDRTSLFHISGKLGRLPVLILQALFHLPVLLEELWRVLSSSEISISGKFSFLLLSPIGLDIALSVRRARADHVHFFWSSWNLVALPFVLRLSNSTCSNFVGAYDLTRPSPFTPIAQNGTDFVTTHAKVNRDAVTTLGYEPEKVNVIYRGVRAPEDVDMDDISDASLHICIVGRLTPAKNVFGITKHLCAAILEHRLPIKIDVYGDGPERDLMIELSNKSDIVEFYGHVDHARLTRAYAQSAVIVLDSHHESERLPNVVKEAMSYGCVPIVSATPGIEELVPKSVGIVCNNSTDICGEVIRLVEDPERLKHFSQAAIDHVDNHFLSDKTVLNFLKLIGRCITVTKEG